MYSKKKIGANIKETREREKISQKKLSELLLQKNVELGREAISKIESGTREISATELFTIAEILKTNPVELMKQEEIIINGPKTNRLFELLSDKYGYEIGKQIRSTGTRIASKALQMNNNVSQVTGTVEIPAGLGKTNHMNMIISMLADNNYKNIIIIMDNRKELQQQLFKHLSSTRMDMVVENIQHLTRNYTPKLLIESVKYDGNIIICRNHLNHFAQIKKYIKDMELKDTATLILDDITLFNHIKTINNVERIGKLEKNIDEIKDLFKKSIYIKFINRSHNMHLNTDFYEKVNYQICNNFSIRPIENFFLVEKFLEADEFKLNKIPKSLLEALSTFLINVSISTLLNKREISYTALFNISRYTKLNYSLNNLIHNFMCELYIALKSSELKKKRDFFIKYLSEAYDDLSINTNVVPEFSSVLKNLSDTILSYHVNLIDLGTDEIYRVKKKYNFIICGKKFGVIDKGIDISNILMIYYINKNDQLEVNQLVGRVMRLGKTYEEKVQIFTNEIEEKNI